MRIGEAAKLVGVTPKAIRHYHKVGLLAEPARSEGGYRLYSADDLLLLRRIRRMQGLGLSLARIREVLADSGATGSREGLTKVLEVLLSETEQRIRSLEERRTKLKDLLEKGPDALESAGVSPTFEAIKETFGDRLSGISPELLEQEEALWATLDAFEWPDDYGEAWTSVARYYAGRPDQHRAWISLGEQVVALKDVPEDSPEVERVAREFACELKANPLPPELSEPRGWAGGPIGQVMSDLMAQNFSPAQRRFMELVAEYGSTGKGSEDGA